MHYPWRPSAGLLLAVGYCSFFCIYLSIRGLVFHLVRYDRMICDGLAMLLSSLFPALSAWERWKWALLLTNILPPICHKDLRLYMSMRCVLWGFRWAYLLQHYPPFYCLILPTLPRWRVSDCQCICLRRLS